MSRLKDLEHQVKELSADQLAAFRQWFAAFDAEAWDQEFEADVAAGKLERAAAQALRDHAAGRSTPLRRTTPRPPSEPATGRSRRPRKRSPTKPSPA